MGRPGDKETGRQGEAAANAILTAGDSPSPCLLVSWSPYLSPTALVITALLAAFLRFHQLDHSSLWSDEGNTWAMLARDFGAIAQAAAQDIHPPGYYWLLKLWSLFFGDSAASMRAFSATAGVLLVGVVAQLGRLAAHTAGARRWMSVLAALLAAVNVFQVYYSQEARMYLLLALESALLFWALFALVGSGLALGAPACPPARGRTRWAAAGFVLAGVAGMWTHYSFPIVLAAANLAFLVHWRGRGRKSAAGAGGGPLRLTFVGLNLLIVLTFVPWLPVAVPSIVNWPKGGAEIGLWQGMVMALRTMSFGPLRDVPDPLWPWLAAAALLPLAGLWALRRTWSAVALGLWLLLPVGLMAVLGLFTPAFLKFLLVASPAWCLLAAAAPFQGGTQIDADLRGCKSDAETAEKTGGGSFAPVGMFLVAGFGVAAAAVALPAYFTSPTARDNYQGVAAYLAAVGDPDRDLVVLDAPGQQEVWRYYDPGLPVAALPAERPPDAARTAAALAEATAGKRYVYALFWATDEADPGNLVEGWLDRSGFKALDSWQGNLRLASYAFAGAMERQPVEPLTFGDSFAVVAQEQPDFPQAVSVGDTALVRLHWDVRRDVDRRYKVSVQLLDDRNQVLAQRDGEPVGGTQPTERWRTGDKIEDNYALPIPFGTPPGRYRLIAAVYDAATGERLLRDGQTHLELGNVTVTRPARGMPPEILPMQHHLAAPLGPVTLAGYDVYRKGFAHAPETAIAPGDIVHFTFYWQAPDPLPQEWPADATFTLRLGEQRLVAPLAGGAYPTGAWQAGEIVRGEFDLEYQGGDRRPALSVDGAQQGLAPLVKP